MTTRQLTAVVYGHGPRPTTGTVTVNDTTGTLELGGEAVEFTAAQVSPDPGSAGDVLVTTDDGELRLRTPSKGSTQWSVQSAKPSGGKSVGAGALRVGTVSAVMLAEGVDPLVFPVVELSDDKKSGVVSGWPDGELGVVFGSGGPAARRGGCGCGGKGNR